MTIEYRRVLNRTVTNGSTATDEHDSEKSVCGASFTLLEAVRRQSIVCKHEW
jgi:hypothetical protein